jgi:hypothetical protein
VPLTTYDEGIRVLRRALDAARVGRSEKLDGMRRLDRLARAIEQARAPEADVDAAIAHERIASAGYGGRTVFDDRQRARRAPRTGQGRLF